MNTFPHLSITTLREHLEAAREFLAEAESGEWADSPAHRDEMVRRAQDDIVEISAAIRAQQAGART